MDELMQEVNLTKHSYMAKQLSRKVFRIKHFGKSSSTPLKSNIDTKKDALERSISGFKHGVNLGIHVVLVGFNRNQIHFLPGFWKIHHLPMFHRLFLA